MLAVDNFSQFKVGNIALQENNRQVNMNGYKWAEQIEKVLDKKSLSLAEAISQKKLYFRLSVTGECNFNCSFCDNEGAPKSHYLDTIYAKRAMSFASKVGFTRIQFTGGEPLLHRDIAAMLSNAKKYFTNIGITTNGSQLPLISDDSFFEPINEIHLSLHKQILKKRLYNNWEYPNWLQTNIEKLTSMGIKVLINLPIDTSDVEESIFIFRSLNHLPVEIRVFTILNQTYANKYDKYLNILENNIAISNKNGGPNNIITLKRYRVPRGVRCQTCEMLTKCHEFSRSLRLGADKVLRPCLASREWDIKLEDLNLDKFRIAALLSTDI